MKRPPGMSLLDYLWVTYGDKGLATDLNDPNGIITTDLLTTVINHIESNSIFSLKSETSSDKSILKGLNKFGEEVSIADFIGSGEKIVKFDRYILTQEDNKIGEVGDSYYRIILDNGNTFYAPITKYSGEESDTISTEVINNKIISTLKLDNPEYLPTVDLKTSKNGLYARLRIDEDVQNIHLISIDGKGLHGEFRWQNSDKLVRLCCLNLDDYVSLAKPDANTIYFIKDLGKIILDSTPFASSNLDIEIQLQTLSSLLKEQGEKIDDLNEILTWYKY